MKIYSNSAIIEDYEKKMQLTEAQPKSPTRQTSFWQNEARMRKLEVPC